MTADDINYISPNLYIGDIYSVKWIDKYNIQAVVTLCPQKPNQYYLSNLQQGCYYYAPIADNNNSKNIEKFEKLIPDIISFIDNFVKRNKNVLIHCYCGISRSATIIALYLIKRKNYKPDDAISTIIIGRPIAFNYGKYIVFEKCIYKE